MSGEHNQKWSGQKILDLPMGRNDAEAATVRDYLIVLLRTLWREGEGFSGKRPFGNSGWEWELYDALVRGGAIEGKCDDDGYLESFDHKAATASVEQAIEALGRAP